MKIPATFGKLYAQSLKYGSQDPSPGVEEFIARGERSPTVRQWTSASLLAILIFVLDCGLLFWAEQRALSDWRS
jgi:hypothetical protein